MNCPRCGKTMAKKLIDQYYCVFCPAVVTIDPSDSVLAKEAIGRIPAAPAATARPF